jgi:lambda family phage portal protein
MIGQVLDSLVGVFNPRAQLSRMAARELIQGKRQYAAAKASVGGWSPIDSDANTEIRTSSPQVRSRVRQLVRDFPYFGRAIDVLVALTVCQGYVLQSQAMPHEDGNRTIRTDIEDAFKRWADQADISGKLTFHELCQLAKRQECECGEFFLIKRQSSDSKRFIPFCLQAIEADRLTALGTPAVRTNEIDQGVEFNPDTGEVLAYWFETDKRPMRVAAADVVHGYVMQRPGQLRGISPFAPGVLAARELGEYLAAEIEGAKMAAKYLAFIESPDLSGFQDLRGVAPGAAPRNEYLENAVLEYLRPGEKINLASHNRPGNNFDPFVRLVLRMLSVTTGVPYELLSADYSGINYSTMRVCRNDLTQILKVHHGRMTGHLCTPVFREVLRQSVLSGRLSLPGYWADPTRYSQAKWVSTGMESIDPLKETKAHVDQLESLLRSPQEIAAARGRDYEELLDEIKEAEGMIAERGLSRGEVSTALAGNPAVIEEEE